MNPDPATRTPPPTTSRAERLFLGLVTILFLGALGLTAAAIHHQKTAHRLTSRIETPMPGIGRLASFTLMERSGTPVSNTNLHSRFIIANAVFTSCSLSCLQVSQRMAELQNATRDTRDVQLLSVTIDPLSDSPGALSEFAKKFDAHPARWLFLTGERIPVYDLLQQSLTGPPNPRLIGTIPGGFNNTDRILLFDQQGQTRVAFDGLSPHVVGDILTLLQELRNP